ncbi:GPI transamidase component GPI16 [Exophiala dermatitidis]
MSRSLLILFYVGLLALSAAASDYFERLTLTPLPLGSLLASFDFRANETVANYETENYRYFPRSLGQALRHAETKELHLRFTTGRWDPDTWGARPWKGTKEGGTGVELWAWVEAASEEQAFDKWTILTQSLSGLFCASLNFIDSTRTTKPALSFQPAGTYDGQNENLHFLHGVLPGEVVCTENLTPFIKLLPCKGKAGISSLLDGHKIFDASWQSMAIDVRPKCPDSDSEKCLMEISQTIDVVLDIERSKRPRDNPIPRPVPAEQLVCDETKPYHSQDACYPRDMTDEIPWSLKEVFGRTVAGVCPLVESEGPEAKSVCLNVPHERMVLIGMSGFEVKSDPGQPESRCYQLMQFEEFDLELPQQTLSTNPDHGHEVLRAERTITGHGAARGGMRTIFTNPSPTDPVEFVYFESLPWFMRPFMHTLKAQITQTEFPFQWQIIKDMHYRPAVDRKRGTLLELVMSVPPASTVMLTYDFEKAILRYTEYPPDANRGFNVAPAVIRVLNNTSTDEPSSDIYIRTTSLLLPLPTPDFSMPYNVIILTSTVMALAFGSIYNLLVRRFVGADEVPGKLLVKELQFRVPLDHSNPKGESIWLFCRSARRFEKPASPKASTAADYQVPWFVYIPGGPGFGCPPPENTMELTNEVLGRGYQLLCFDHRGMGLSTPATAATITARGSPTKQAEYLSHFRADNAVRDLEAIRKCLTSGYPDDKKKWTIMGTSYGGFVCLTYLSFYPEGLREAFPVAGMAPITERVPDEAVRNLFVMVKDRNQKYYAKYPEDEHRVRRILKLIRDNEVRLPSGDILTVGRFLEMGLHFGFHGGLDKVHNAVFRASHDIETFGYLTRPTLSNIESMSWYNDQPLYGVLHGSIYAQSAAPRWAFDRILQEFPEFQVNLDGPYARVLFTGEMVFRRAFQDYGELRPLAAAAELMESKNNWDALYDLEQLRRNEVPVYAAIYVEDMYVDFNFSRQAASLVKGCKTFITNMLYHDAVRAKTADIMKQLFALRDDTID